MSVNLRYRALWAEYDAHPNKCLHCKSDLKRNPKLTLGQNRERKFCDRKCAALHNNKARDFSSFNSGPKAKERVCGCGALFRNNAHRRSMLCPKCVDLRDNKVANRTIAAHALYVLKNSGRNPICCRCGYHLFVDTCHIKPVKDFASSALLREINDLSNLCYMCPNCHAEHDNGLWSFS